MLKMLINCLVLVCSLNACASDPIFGTLDKSQRKHNENQRQTLLIMMDLDELYPDSHVRALAKAAGKGDILKVRQLVASGVNVNAQGRSKATPLYWAIRKNNLAGFEALLKLGATPNVRFDDSGTMMHWATRHQDSRFLQLALSYGGDPNLRGGMYDSPAIWETVKSENTNIPNNYYQLIAAGTDLEIKDNIGTTLLGHAAALGRYDVVLDLLNRGANFQMVNRMGMVLLFHCLDRDEKVLDNKSSVYQQKKKVEQWLRDRNIDYSKVKPEQIK
ncbi:ankyrin repeat domain-containing protein [Rheinheimera soli]|uniref:ankyrin repeat domain-containing protein n=2 Tax=Rheinheimera soli TaxID=443616 RepID=UPI001E3E6D9B|nr:ankyrin repeat domain-containing protein [Rheinheimera soli]